MHTRNLDVRAVFCAAVCGTGAFFAVWSDPLPAAALEWTEFSAISRSEGRADLFGIDDEDRSVSHMWQSGAADPWVGPELVASPATDLAVAPLEDDRFEVFAVGDSGQLLHSAQDYDTFAWSEWRELASDVSAKRIAAAKLGGRVAVFYVGVDDAIWAALRESPGDDFGAWTNLELSARELAVVATDDGTFSVFAIGTDAAVWHAQLDAALAPLTVWENLGGQARAIAASREAGSDIVAALGEDGVAYVDREIEAGWTGWVATSATGDGGDRVELVEVDGAMTLLTLGGGKLSRSVASAEGTWSDPALVLEASPLDTTFEGTARVSIPDQDVSEERAITLGIRFGIDRSRVEISDFPAIRTDSFDTPFGETRSTVSLIGNARGEFDPDTGRLEIPVTLEFDQSLDLPLVSEDATASFRLNTDRSPGMALDRDTRTLALAAKSAFDGRGSLNPLDGLRVEVLITGSLADVP